MKKRLYFITTALVAIAALSLSSCLKDSRYVSFANGGTVLNFPTGGLGHFGADAVTDPSDTIVKQFAVEIASPAPPSANTDINIAVDNSIIATYKLTNNAVDYQPMPDGSYTLSATKVTVPAGQRSAAITVTFYKALLDPSKSYMLPIKIVGGPAGAIVSGNFGIHYYHFIGNDFAGTWTQNFRRWNGGADSVTGSLSGASFAGHTATFSPVTPNEFQVATGYAGGAFVYDVTFTKNGDGTYSNFAVSFTDASIAGASAGGIALTQSPVFLNPPFSPAGPLNFTQASQIWHFQFKAHTSADRYLVDEYARP